MKKLLIFTTFLISCGPGTDSISSKQLSCSVQTLVESSVLPNGGTLITCPDGSSSLIMNSAIIEPVQFCPGTPSYPSTFPEVGWCLNGELYAVYSSNDGFLTLIPPGNYQSNAIGSSCNFI